MQKKILFIILVLTLACLVFYSGFHFGQKISSSEKARVYLSYYFSGGPPGGYATIKEIDINNYFITLASQTSKDKTLKAKLGTGTRYFQAIRKENGSIEREPIKPLDLKTDDQVYFVVRINQDGSFTLLLLTVESATPK